MTQKGKQICIVLSPQRMHNRPPQPGSAYEFTTYFFLPEKKMHHTDLKQINKNQKQKPLSPFCFFIGY